ncbi:MAG: hypothetical protein IPH71_12535 [Proteobacteria bacterium]|nr:hypothetical protein [Pseudomonadota bacterium]
MLNTVLGAVGGLGGWRLANLGGLQPASGNVGSSALVGLLRGRLPQRRWGGK